MGLTNAAATFQRLMNKVILAEIQAVIVVVYMNDLLIHFKKQAENKWRTERRQDSSQP